MKLTKKQLQKIIAEEYKAVNNDKHELSRLVREAYANYTIRTYPKHFLNEGVITKSQYNLIVSGRLDERKKSDKKETADEKGIGDVVADYSVKIGTQVGRGALGVGKGLWNAIFPIAKEVGKAGARLAVGTLRFVGDNIGNALSDAGKIAGDSIGGARDAFKNLRQAAAQGRSYSQMAESDPEAYLTVYRALRKKLLDMGAPVKTAAAAKAALGVFETDEGEAALVAGAEKGGVTPDELKSMMGLFVIQSAYVKTARRAMEDRDIEAAKSKSVSESKLRIEKIVDKIIK